MNYTNILIPLDGSEDSKFACRVAADLTKAIPGKETLHLLHCIPPIPNLIGGEQRVKLKQDHLDRTEHIFTIARAILKETKNTVQTYVRYGDPAPTIVDTAKELNCSLIIMGTRGMGELQSIVLGSVSHDVLQLSPVPVLLVNKNRSITERK